MHSRGFSLMHLKTPSIYFSIKSTTFVQQGHRQQQLLWQNRNCAFSHCTLTPNSIVLRTFHSDKHKHLMSEVAAQTQAMNEENTAAVRKRKQTLRKEVRARIKSTYHPNDHTKLVEQSNLVFSRIFTLPQYQSAKSIGFFLSMPSGEIQTRDAIRRMVRDGKDLYVPRVGLDFEKCDMDLVRAGIDASSESTDELDGEGQLFYDVWPKNKWNIPEPPVGSDTSAIAKQGDIDLLLVPGLAFDSNGHRLGQGKGYYDRFISKMRSDVGYDHMENESGEIKPLLVGVCLGEQFLNEVGFEGIPVTDHDFIMDMVITPTTTLIVPRN